MPRPIHRSLYCWLAVISATAALVPSTPLFGAELSKEVSTAAEHAGYAADAALLTTTQAHLHHTVNCLVGPNGKGFDESFGNPCNGQGNGAIPETTDAATKTKLESALTVTRQAVATSDMTAAKKGASDTAAMLK